MKLKIKPDSTCSICGNTFVSLMGLARHIPNAHNISIEKYYRKYIYPNIKDSANDDICDFCGNKTRFISIVEGYHRFCCSECSSNWRNSEEKRIKEKKLNKLKKKFDKEELFGIDFSNPFDAYARLKKRLRTRDFKYRCEVCGDRFEKQLGLSVHIMQQHKLTLEDYYKYNVSKNEKDGICLNCGKKTEFISIDKGYKKYCCHSCEVNYVVANGIKFNIDDSENKCKICGREFDDGRSLRYHIKYGHHISLRKYYKKLILPSLKNAYNGKCLNCNNKTKLVSLNFGFLPFCCDECAVEYRINTKHKINKSNKLKCGLCGCAFNSIRSLSQHLAFSHTVSAKRYYDLFLKESKAEGKCLWCNNKTRFVDLTHGYLKFCNSSCVASYQLNKNIEYNLKEHGVPYYIQSKDFREKAINTYREETGYDNPSQNPDVIKKKEENYLKKTGYIHPSHNPEVIEKRNKTNVNRYGVPCVLSNHDIRAKGIDTYREETGYDNPSQNPDIKKKKAETLSEHYGVDIKTPLECEDILNEMYENNLDKYGTKFIAQVKEFREKGVRTYHRNTGYDYPFQNPEWRERIEQERFERTGYRNPSQNPEIRKKMFNFKNGSRSEIKFKKKLKKHNIKFTEQYYLRNELLGHHFDFAIFDSKDNLKCLVEIDGELCHGLRTDCNGDRIRGDKDYLRWELVPKGVKYLVIDSQRLKEGFKELRRILPIDYKTWKKEMLRSIPKDIKDAIPKFSEKRMLYDWKRLCELDYHKNAFLGKSILLHFCRSHWNTLKDDWKEIRKTLYKSPCSEHHVLEGLDTFRNVSKLREKYRKKFAKDDFVVFKHHSPEKMLAICSLGKTYFSKEPIDKESIKIIGFLKLKAYEEDK